MFDCIVALDWAKSNMAVAKCQGKVIMSAFWQSENVRFFIILPLFLLHEQHNVATDAYWPVFVV
jgi:hypothetical protein